VEENSVELSEVLYHAIYELALRPIAGNPGPKLAAWTTLYAAYYDVYLPGQYVFKIKKLHKRYGKSLSMSHGRCR
jgi:hypothetical protein